MLNSQPLLAVNSSRSSSRRCCSSMVAHPMAAAAADTEISSNPLTQRDTNGTLSHRKPLIFPKRLKNSIAEICTSNAGNIVIKPAAELRQS